MSLRSAANITPSSEVEPLLASSGKDNEITAQPFIAVCWGCGLELTLPFYTNHFNCGYCGAYTTEDKRSTENHRPIRNQPCGTCIAARDIITSSVMFIVILGIIGGGVWSVFPVLFSEFSPEFYLNSLVTLILGSNTIFNFIMASKFKAGPVPRKGWGDVASVPRGSLEGYTFCDKCRNPKPRGAHHCRQCGECVMEMDHHCPFIGNCVGANNQRYFIVMLSWVLVSCSYVATMCSLAVSNISSKLMPTDSRGVELGLGGGILGTVALTKLFHVEAALAFRLMVIGYLFFIAIVCIVAAAVLLYQQLQLVLEGQTYIESIQASAPAHRGFLVSVVEGIYSRTIMTRLRHVFGDDYPLLWLAPRLSHPAGSLAAYLSFKLHNC